MSTQTASQSHYFDNISEVGELIRHRKFSPVELVTSCLERTNDLQPRLNAFIR